MMVPEGGTGSLTSGASVRAIYEALFGVSGQSIDSKQAILPGGGPVDTLPVIEPDGTIVAPKDSGLPKQEQDQSSLPATGPRTSASPRRGHGRRRHHTS